LASANDGSETLWRRCSVCKKGIALGAVHWVCSVSTCNRKRTSLVFCDVDCWEVHPEMERHREAYAVEARAPKTLDPPEPPKTERTRRGSTAARTPSAGKSFVVRKTTGSGTPSASASGPANGSPPSTSASEDILVVASRLKAYVKATSGFNTSDRVLPVLSKALRSICDEAIENARQAERQTVMDRDVPRD